MAGGKHFCGTANYARKLGKGPFSMPGKRWRGEAGMRDYYTSARGILCLDGLRAAFGMFHMHMLHNKCQCGEFHWEWLTQLQFSNFTQRLSPAMKYFSAEVPKCDSSPHQPKKIPRISERTKLSEVSPIECAVRESAVRTTDSLTAHFIRRR